MEIGICEKGLLEYMRKSTPPPFLLKTFMLVEDPETDEIVSWNAEGTAFVVWQPAEFSRDLLPTHFKHSNFSSFVRQLNTYGFRKITTNRWEFCNDKFQKDKKEKLCEIHRRKAWSSKNKSQPATSAQAEDERVQQKPDFSDDEQKSSSTSSSSGLSSLVEENKRLKRENGALSTELSSVKSKCRELLDLVAKYARQNDPEKEDEQDSGQEVCDEYDHRPKLFGVRLEVEGEIMKKRKRAEVSRSARVLLSQACK